MKRYAPLLAMLLAGCVKETPRVSFPVAQCNATPTEELRERRIRTTCSFRQGAKPGGVCLSWNHRNITERKEIVSCSKEQWVRQ
jgi:hypothetical protein